MNPIQLMIVLICIVVILVSGCISSNELSTKRDKVVPNQSFTQKVMDNTDNQEVTINPSLKVTKKSKDFSNDGISFQISDSYDQLNPDSYKRENIASQIAQLGYNEEIIGKLVSSNNESKITITKFSSSKITDNNLLVNSIYTKIDNEIAKAKNDEQKQGKWTSQYLFVDKFFNPSTKSEVIESKEKPIDNEIKEKIKEGVWVKYAYSIVTYTIPMGKNIYEIQFSYPDMVGAEGDKDNRLSIIHSLTITE